MKYGNELKVGIAVVLSIIVFIVGVRYFQDLPIFSGTLELYTTFENADGLIVGNPVQINGVRVGRVNEVRLRPETRNVLVRFQVDRDLQIPEGSTTRVSGLSALSSVSVVINLADARRSAVSAGDTLTSDQTDVLGNLVDQAPRLVHRADSLFGSATTTLNTAEQLLARPESDLRQTLVAIGTTARTVDQLLRTEQQRLASTLESVDTLATSLADFSTTNQDSLSLAVQRLNRSLTQLERNLTALEQTTTTLDAILQKVNQGEGTLGLLVNDPGLYHRLDSTTTQLNRLLVDFQQNPKRYLKDLKLVEVF
ncbi:MAG: MCE family protein [Bacteroidetes bacterium]|nr:MCE family protein [Bacteroidota bacterium]